MVTLTEFSAALHKRDETEQQLVQYFDLFNQASGRAVKAEQLLRSKSKTEKATNAEIGEVSEQMLNENKESDTDTELVDRLKSSRAELKSRLNLIQFQLNQAQERLRAVNEEQYLKIHAVEGLHDEILALTMQLNLSEEKRKKLQDDLGR